MIKHPNLISTQMIYSLPFLSLLPFYRREGDFYSCTCPSWRNLTSSEKSRTCAHLKTLLGEEYEQIRIRLAKNRQSNLSTIKRTGSDSSTQTLKRTASDAFHKTPTPSSSLSATPDSDPDVFPYSTSTKSPKKIVRYFGRFNERDNGGPRGLNGAAPLLLAHKWPETKNPEGYWLSEKLDGVRAWWNGEKMYARSGRAWNPPQWFKDKLPKDLHLDGELWMKRDAFDSTSGICRRVDSDHWNLINLMTFDVTNVPLPYEQRLQLLRTRLRDGEKTPDQVEEATKKMKGGMICVLPAVKCTGKAHFEELMKQVLQKGGEGLMLRQPGSMYESGRSKSLYKHKLWYDAEALVIGHEWGQGEHKGRMGACTVKMQSGHVISIGSGFSHAQRNAWQPDVGMIIRYRFQELSHDGFPRFPIYEGTCPDKSEPCDAIVRSHTFRAEAEAEKLQRNLDEKVAQHGKHSTAGPSQFI